MSDKFPFYIHKIRENSEFLRDDKGYSVLSGHSDVGYSGYIKDAAISCFNAFNKADDENQKLFFSRLIREMASFAYIEWDWPAEEVEERMVRILRGEQREEGKASND